MPNPPPHRSPPSPSTTAAAMSLGTLAAAASLAASTPYYFHHPQPFLRPPPLPSMSQLPRPKHSLATPVAPAPSATPLPPPPAPKPKQRRYRATPEQLSQLIARFEVNPSPTSTELQQLAARINMPVQSAVLWFKNRRARVPHKKDKADKRRKEKEQLKTVSHKVSTSSSSNSTNINSSTVSNINSNNASNSNNSNSNPKLALPAEVAAAASMAEMAMAATHTPVSKVATTTAPRKTQSAVSMPEKPLLPPRPLQIVHAIGNMRTPSMSPPLYRNRNCDAVPFDSALVKRLSSEHAQFGTPRRPRAVPPTPRLCSQIRYRAGDKVEVMETGKGICRAWYSATVLGRCSMGGINEISLGRSAIAVKVSMDNGYGQNEQGDGGDSPRTVTSPMASPTRSSSKMWYLIRYEGRYDQHGKELEEEVVASRVRPAPPECEDIDGNWRPEPGEAVEVLRDGTWFVAMVHTFAVRKGYMVSFESGDVQWVRRNGVRPYQMWRGGNVWVLKRKAPLAVVRKSVGLSVTHPPGGKRKRSSEESRGRSKRLRSMNVDCSGPDGLPGGWRVDYRGVRIRGRSQSYIAPDGMKLRSLKEAQRYVKLMGPA